MDKNKYRILKSTFILMATTVHQDLNKLLNKIVINRQEYIY